MPIIFPTLLLGLFIVSSATIISNSLLQIAKEKKRANDIREKELSN